MQFRPAHTPTAAICTLNALQTTVGRFPFCEKYDLIWAVKKKFRSFIFTEKLCN
jgi:hypothetical protein